MTKTPELPLDKDEAHMLAKPLAEIQELYPNTIMSREQLAWLNLFIALGYVTAPRWVLIRQRLREEKAKNITPKPEVSAPQSSPVPPAAPQAPVAPSYAAPVGGNDPAAKPFTMPKGVAPLGSF